MIDKSELNSNLLVEINPEQLQKFQEIFLDLSKEFDALSVDVDRAMDLFEVDPLEGTKAAQEVLAKKLVAEVAHLKDKQRAASRQFFQEVPQSSRESLFDAIPESAVLDQKLAQMSQEFYSSLPLEILPQTLCDESMLMLAKCHNHAMESEFDADDKLVTRYKGYYLMYTGDPEPRQAYQAIRDLANEHPELPFSEPQLKVLQDGEDGIYKLHLNVNSSNYKWSIISIFDYIYKAKGKAPFTQWKLRPYNQNAANDRQLDPDALLSTFVFYVDGTSQTELFDHLRRQAEGVVEALQRKQVRIPSDTRTPRYSAPVTLDGKNVPGLFFTQSDGSYKTFLKNRGQLAEKYDATKNYAVRVGQPSPFE